MQRSCLLKSHYFLFSPVPQINWRRTDGMPFPSKIKLRKSNGMIEIPNFQQEDAGLYECITENSRGKNIARGRLTYYGRKLFSIPLSYPSLHMKYKPLSISLGFTASTIPLQICSSKFLVSCREQRYLLHHCFA